MKDVANWNNGFTLGTNKRRDKPQSQKVSAEQQRQIDARKTIEDYRIQQECLGQDPLE